MEEIKVKPVLKITLAASFMALAFILTIFGKMLAEPIRILPFVQLNFSTAIIAFSSIALGPLYGAIVGIGSDLLGMVYEFHPPYNPIYTVIAMLWGIIPWLLYKLFKNIKSNKAKAITLVSLVSVSYLLLISLFYIFKVVNFKQANDVIKLVISIVTGVSFVAFIIVVMLLHWKKKLEIFGMNLFDLSIIIFISFILLGVISTAGALQLYFKVLSSSSLSFTYFELFGYLLVWVLPNLLLDLFIMYMSLKAYYHAFRNK